MDVSIIVPVYNVEAYLARCLDSCVHQNIPESDYEIILVNDGSLDGSRSIAEKYVLEHSNVKLYNQENGGLSVARNNGLKVAKGKYIWFVDSDDWIEENCLSDVVKIAEDQNLDMLQIGYKHVYEDGITKIFNRGLFDGCKTGCKVMKETIIPPPVPFTIYKKDFLVRNSLTFYPGIYHEDAEFKPRAVFYAERFASLKKHLYNYYQRSNGSIMSHYSIKLGLDKLTVCERLLNFERDVTMDSDMRREFDFIISGYINAFFRGIATLKNDEKQLLISAFSTHKKLITCMKDSKSNIHRIEGWLLSINVPIGFKIINKMLQR